MRSPIGVLEFRVEYSRGVWRDERGGVALLELS